MKKTVLITGASRGIGRAIALAYARENYNLYLTCRTNMELLTSLKNQIRDTYPVECHIYSCDCSDYSQVLELFSVIPCPDVLINNAGISYIGLLSDMSVEDWNHIIHTNLNSVFYTCKHVIDGMVARKQGKIINISSVWANTGASMEAAYCASKGGVNSLTRALAKELAPSNIQVNAIACGLIDTDMNSCFSARELQAVIEDIPADRMGTAEEVASLCVMLSRAPSYFTGQILTIDGGWQ